MHIHVSPHLPAAWVPSNGRLKNPCRAAAASVDSTGSTESHLWWLFPSITWAVWYNLDEIHFALHLCTSLLALHKEAWTAVCYLTHRGWCLDTEKTTPNLPCIFPHKWRQEVWVTPSFKLCSTPRVYWEVLYEIPLSVPVSCAVKSEGTQCLLSEVTKYVKCQRHVQRLFRKQEMSYVRQIIYGFWQYCLTYHLTLRRYFFVLPACWHNHIEFKHWSWCF